MGEGTFGAQLSWDDDAWVVASDPAWRRGCRWLQSRWREVELGLPAGPRLGASPDALVASMLPSDVADDENFLSAEIGRAVEMRLAEGDHSGIINEARLRRNLLSSQPACFNLFGPFVGRPGALLAWVQSLDPEAEVVAHVGFEWAPDRKRHFGGGSAFDAIVRYQALGQPRFLGIECKYAEDLGESRIASKGTTLYGDHTRRSGRWRDGAVDALDHRRLRQIWLNTLLSQSCTDNEPGLGRGRCVVVACADDTAARTAVDAMREQLYDPAELVWSPYEEVLTHISEPDLAEWRGRFADRYLRFDRVAHKLAADDPRRSPRMLRDLDEAAQHLLQMCRRVTGDGSVLDQVHHALAQGGLHGAPSAAVLDAAGRAQQLADDLRALRAEPLFDLVTEKSDAGTGRWTMGRSSG